MAIASFPFNRIFSAISSDFYTVNRNYGVRTYNRAAAAADASFSNHFGIMVTFIIDHFRQLNAGGRAICHADCTSFAFFLVNVNRSFECHIVKCWLLMIYVSEPVPICENHAQICSKNKQNNWIFEYFINFYANFGTIIK